MLLQVLEHGSVVASLLAAILLPGYTLIAVRRISTIIRRYRHRRLARQETRYGPGVPMPPIGKRQFAPRN